MSNYALAREGNRIVPASHLDNVLVSLKDRHLRYSVSYYDQVSGEPLLASLTEQYNRKMANRTGQRIYDTTDHTPMSVSFATQKGMVNIVYVSLDNSVKSSQNGMGLVTRLKPLVALVAKITGRFDDCVVFFSEACRASFIEVDGVSTPALTWCQIRHVIESELGLTYLCESKNNECPLGMSFGVAAFTTTAYRSRITNLFCENLLKPGQGWGSGCVGVQLDDDIIWAIHFPVDFKAVGVNNLGYAAMVQLCLLMDQFKGSALALGDFNLIPGVIRDATVLALEERKDAYEFGVDFSNLTFYGAFYDLIEPRKDEIWIDIV